MSTTPVPGAEDLYPHVSLFDEPGHELHGEVICPPRTLGLLMAPSVDEFLEEWSRHEQAINAGFLAGEFRFPGHWARGAKRRSKELQARYNTDAMLDVLRGLHREHGVFPKGVKA